MPRGSSALCCSEAEDPYSSVHLPDGHRFSLSATPLSTNNPLSFSPRTLKIKESWMSQIGTTNILPPNPPSDLCHLTLECHSPPSEVQEFFLGSKEGTVLKNESHTGKKAGATARKLHVESFFLGEEYIFTHYNSSVKRAEFKLPGHIQCSVGNVVANPHAYSLEPT